MANKPSSVFDNHEFVNGFIDFYESPMFEKYMVPFMAELIESYRDRLETTKEATAIQNRIAVVRMMLGMGDTLKRNKKAIAEANG
jgi:hypothetical protein